MFIGDLPVDPVATVDPSAQQTGNFDGLPREARRGLGASREERERRNDPERLRCRRNETESEEEQADVMPDGCTDAEKQTVLRNVQRACSHQVSLTDVWSIFKNIRGSMEDKAEATLDRLEREIVGPADRQAILSAIQEHEREERAEQRRRSS